MKRTMLNIVLLLSLALVFAFAPAASAQGMQANNVDFGEVAFAESYDSLAPALPDVWQGSTIQSRAIAVDTANLYYVESYVLAALYTDGSFEYYPSTREFWGIPSTGNPGYQSQYAGYARIFYVTIMEAGTVLNQQAQLTSGTLYLNQIFYLGSTWQPSSVYVGGITLKQYGFFSGDHTFKYSYKLPTGLNTWTGYVMY